MSKIQSLLAQQRQLRKMAGKQRAPSLSPLGQRSHTNSGIRAHTKRARKKARMEMRAAAAASASASSSESESDTPQHEGSPAEDEPMESRQTQAQASQPSNQAMHRAQSEAAASNARHAALHFGKIVTHFRFGNSASAFLPWSVRFKIELRSFDLEGVLASDPALHAQLPPHAQHAEHKRQEAVYGMILKCVPDEVVPTLTSAVPQHEQTGFKAWQALRQFYLGDSQKYLQSLEGRFHEISWQDGETFVRFEARFQSLLGELDAMGAHKLDPAKKNQLLRAILRSSHKDAHGAHVFDRFNTVAKIKDGQEPLGFAEWLAALRSEAQEIEESVEMHSKGKSARDAEVGDRQVQDVSFVAAAGPGPMRAPPQSLQQAGRRNPPATHLRRQLFNPRSHRQEACRDFLRRGQCAYGANCRYSHSQPSSSGGPGGQQGAHGEQAQRDQTCFQFKATGQCARANCRFRHSRSAAAQHGAAAGEQHGAASRNGEPRFGADAFVIERANAVFKGGPEAVEDEPAHRVLLDSCDSIHLTPKAEFVTNLRELARPVWVRGAFGAPVECRYGGEGAVPIGENVLRVDELVYCPQLRDTLLSMVKLARESYTFDLQPSGGTLTPNTGEFTLAIHYEGEIFTLAPLADKQSSAEVNVVTRAARRREDEAVAAPSVEPVEQKEPTQLEDTAASNDSAAAPTAPHTPLPTSVQLAHARYGHLCGRKLGQLAEFDAAAGLLPFAKSASHDSLVQACDACMRAKMSRVKFGKALDYHAHAPNDAAAADVCGPIWTERLADGAEVKHSCSLIVDLYSGRVNLRFIKRKNEASHHGRSYFFSSETETGRKLRHFHADGGLEYNEVEQFLEAKGVKVTRTPAHTPQRNGVAERKNRTLLEATRTLLQHAGLDPARFWADALNTAVFLHNRVNVAAKHGKTPHELFTGQRPDLSLLRVFGCDAFVRVADPRKHGKLDQRSEKGIFVGYDLKKELCYRILVKDEQGERIVVSRDVKFREDSFTVDREPGGSESAAAASGDTAAASNGPLAHRIEEFFEHAASNSVLESASEGEQEPAGAMQSGGDEEPLDRRTLRAIHAAERRGAVAQPTSEPAGRPVRARKPARQTGLNPDDFSHFALATSVVEPAGLDNSQQQPQFRQSEVSVPSTRRAALRSPHAREWQSAMEAEMESIRAHGTFVLTPRPEGVNVVSCRWVFAVKAKDGWVQRFKARLVARGFSQQLGVDYEETYAPVLKYKTLRLLLALIAALDLCFELMDVQTAYLNAPLKETVYMQQPDGFEQGGAGQVCLLKRAIYGLKQAGREWNETLNEFIVQELGFHRCVNESCLYVRRSRSGHPLIISVYVDDIPSAFHAADRAEWEEVKGAFFRRFAIKFLGEADWLLNMRITRDRSRRTLLLDQQAYCESMLEDLQMDDCKLLLHPGAPEELSKAGGPPEPEGPEQRAQARHTQGQYRRAVGLLTYLANTSRPDIAHSVHLVAQFAQNPGAIHFRAVKAILRYLCGTAAYALVFDGRESLEARLGAPSAGAHTGQAGEATQQNSSGQLRLTVYADANWGGCKDSRRSTTGYLVALGGSWIDWNCHKQATVALSSCEAEYMALASATTAVKWTVKLLREIGLLDEGGGGGVLANPVPVVLSDNKAAIALARNDVHHSRSKHIDIRHHFIRDEIREGRIAVHWVSSQEQVADILTKTLLPKLFLQFRDNLVAPLPALVAGARQAQQDTAAQPHTPSL